MSIVPTSYSVPPPIANLPSIDSAENTARLAQVEELGSIVLSETASASDKMDAFKTLRNMGKGSREIGARDAIVTAYWLVTESPFAKQIDAAGSTYSSTLISSTGGARSRGEDIDGGKLNLDYLSRHSEEEQRVIAYSLGKDLESWKAQLEQQSADFVAQHPPPAVKITLSDQARTALSQPPGGADADQEPKTAAEQALAALKSEPSSVSSGAMALKMLKSAAEAREAREKEQKEASQQWVASDVSKPADLAKPNRPYVAGDNADKSV